MTIGDVCGKGVEAATAAYVTLTQATGRVDVQVSLAGHPRALCRRADGEVTAVGVPGTILGSFDAEQHEGVARPRATPPG